MSEFQLKVITRPRQNILTHLSKIFYDNDMAMKVIGSKHVRINKLMQVVTLFVVKGTDDDVKNVMEKIKVWWDEYNPIDEENNAKTPDDIQVRQKSENVQIFATRLPSSTEVVA